MHLGQDVMFQDATSKQGFPATTTSLCSQPRGYKITKREGVTYRKTQAHMKPYIPQNKKIEDKHYLLLCKVVGYNLYYLCLYVLFCFSILSYISRVNYTKESSFPVQCIACIPPYKTIIHLHSCLCIMVGIRTKCNITLKQSLL